MSTDLPGMGGDFAKGASGPQNVYDTSPTGLGISPAYLAPGAVASASSSSGTSLLGHETKAAAVSTSGTTFAGGADLLAAALSFTADGTSDYVVGVFAESWSSSAGADGCQLNLNLDSADGGRFARHTGTEALVLAARIPIIAPTAGNHTVNVRLVAVTAGTATVDGSVSPILVTLEKLA